MDRWVIDLGKERKDYEYWVGWVEYLYVGDCTGTVRIKLKSQSASPLNPEEFDKISDIGFLPWIYITNTAQVGKELVLYIERRKGGFKNGYNRQLMS